MGERLIQHQFNVSREFTAHAAGNCNVDAPLGVPLPEAAQEKRLTAGGQAANILHAFRGLYQFYNPDHSHFRLHGRVGLDPAGEAWRDQTKFEGVEIDPTEPTNLLLFRFTGDSYEYEIREGASLYTKLLPEIENDHIDLFITEASILRHPNLVQEVGRGTQALENSRGSLAINISNISHEKSSATINYEKSQTTSPIQVLRAIKSFKVPPDVVVGNGDELEQLSGLLDVSPTVALRHVARNVLPDTKVVVMTLAGKGSRIMFDDEMIDIPAVEPKHKENAHGVGDVYMGALLAYLYQIPVEQWTRDHVEKAGKVGAYAATKVLGKKETRLEDEEFADVYRFSQTLN